MSFINVNFGYNQSRLFNTNCELAPLLDAIHNECFSDMKAKLIEREEFFNKDITQFKKDQANLEKKLDKLEVPPEPTKPPPVVATKKNAKDNKAGKPKKKTKKELEEEEAVRKAKEEEERRLKEEEEERLRKQAEEEERKRKEEEEAAKKAKGGKDKKKPGKQEEEPPQEEQAEETEEQKLEREKKELKEKIEQIKAKIEQYVGKTKLCQEEREKLEAERQRKKVTDLVEKNSQERKFLKAGARDFANTLLGERRCYQFVELKKNPEDENADEEPVLIKIDGKAIRTPDEDIKWEEEQRELEAAAPKGGKAPPKGKKK